MSWAICAKCQAQNAGNRLECRECGTPITPPDGSSNARRASPYETSRVGTVLDFAGPAAITLILFFGTQAYFNAGDGPTVTMGGGWFLRLIIPGLGLYFFIVKPILRQVSPDWWPSQG